MTAFSQQTARVDELTVGQVAEEFGITVRTLHHYDEIGLLTPSARTRAGYRLYPGADLEDLAAIVTYRRLGFPLETVATLLRDEESRREHLVRQRAAVISQVAELTRLVDAIDHALEREMSTTPAAPDDLKDLFGSGFDDDYPAEAEQRWGQSQAWQQSQSRTKGLTRADWEAIKVEADEVNAAFAAALDAGLPADSPEAMEAAEAHRRHIHERFYDLDYTMHTGLAQLYVSDPRFTATYDDLRPGLAVYVHDAIVANAARHA